MPQLNAYLSDELFEALNRYVSDLNEGQPGANASRSSVTAAALRAFLLPSCPEKGTKIANTDTASGRSRRSPKVK
jgi:hypothetical protein